MQHNYYNFINVKKYDEAINSYRSWAQSCNFWYFLCISKNGWPPNGGEYLGPYTALCKVAEF